jgi:hypothetical protein
MWPLYVAFALVAIAAFALQPKVQKPPTPVLDDVQIPQAAAGLEIPVLFGCREMRSPNVLWYGDLRTTAIKTKGGKK